MVIITPIFLASLDMNVWQFLKSRKLMQKYVDAVWEPGNSRANMARTPRQLKACAPDMYADPK